MGCRASALSIGCALLLAAAPALPQDLVGLDYAVTVDRVSVSSCTLRPVCPAPRPPLAPHAFPAGGADWDTCTNTLWATDGRAIVNLDKDCQILCAFTGPTPALVWTGLAVDSINRLVYTSAATGEIVQWRIVGGAQCLQLVARCVLPATSTAPITGLAYDAFTDGLWAVDAVGGAVFFSFSSGGCQIRCRFQAQCPPPSPVFGRVTGAAYDSCAQLLYMVTEPSPAGLPPVLIVNQVLTPVACGRTIRCCPIQSPTVAPLSGIGFAPGKAVTPPNAPGCSPRGCPPCEPVIGSRGTPAIGTNRCFTVTVDRAPCPSSAYLLVSLGPCSPVTVPGLCGPVWINPASLLLVLPGTIPACPALCGGSVSWTLPIPLARTLCGLDLCAQAAFVGAGGCISLSGPLPIQLVGP